MEKVREEQKYHKKLGQKVDSDLAIAGHRMMLLDRKEQDVELDHGQIMKVKIVSREEQVTDKYRRRK